MIYLLVVLSLICAAICIVLFLDQYRRYMVLKANQDRIVTVLGALGPELGSRLREGTTAVVVPDQWNDDVAWDLNDVN